MTLRTKTPQLALILFMVGGLAGCTVPADLPIFARTGEAASAYQTVSVLLTQTAVVTISSTQVGETVIETATSGPLAPQNTVDPSSLLATPSPSGLPSPGTTRTPQGQAAAPPCDLATAGNPIDVTVPDDTVFRPGESFVKTWRLVNSGSCIWTREYALVYFSGTDLALRREDAFRVEVRPGQEVELSLDMVAPMSPGVYQGNYKLRANNGRLFGIGPEGGSPFWVRISVVPEETATPTLTLPTQTPTPQVLLSSSAVLEIDQSYDLDLAMSGPTAGDDLALQKNGDALEWVALNGARFLVQGTTQPSMEVCRSSPASADTLTLGIEMEGSYLCARTSRGLPARIMIVKRAPDQSTLEIQFTIWSIP